MVTSSVDVGLQENSQEIDKRRVSLQSVIYRQRPICLIQGRINIHKFHLNRINQHQSHEKAVFTGVASAKSSQLLPSLEYESIKINQGKKLIGPQLKSSTRINRNDTNPSSNKNFNPIVQSAITKEINLRFKKQKKLLPELTVPIKTSQEKIKSDSIFPQLAY